MTIRIALLSLFMVSFASTQDKAGLDSGTVLLHALHDDWLISMPHGWALDSSKSITDSPDIMLYTSKGTVKWNAIITLEAATKAVEGKNTLNNLLTWFATIDSVSPKTVAGLPKMTSKDKREVTLRGWVRARQWLSHAYVGYVDERDNVVVITLMTQNQQDLDNYLPAFTQVIESYSLMSKGRSK
jgi:hypothetical protein